MTLEQLSNLSDEELNRLAAERVMGWTYQLGLGRPADYAIYIDGQRGGYFVSSYTPTTNRNQSGDLLAAMVGRGATFSIGFNLNEPFVALLEILPESTRWAEKNGPRARWNSIPGASARSETIAALLAWQALESGETNPEKP